MGKPEAMATWYEKLFLYVVVSLQVVDLILLALAYKADMNTKAVKVLGVLVPTVVFLLLIFAMLWTHEPTSPVTIVIMTTAIITTVLSILSHLLKANKVLWVFAVVCRIVALVGTSVYVCLAHITQDDDTVRCLGEV